MLVLDTPIPGIAEEYGDFGDNAVALLKDNPLPLVKYTIAFDLSHPDLPLLEATFVRLTEGISSGVIKGVYLTGSRSDSFVEGNPWIDRLSQFIKATLFTKADFPIVGVCFGHQILAKNLGCKVGRNTAENGWECGTTTISLNHSIMSIDKSPFPEALQVGDKQLEHINMVEFHRDIVYGLPPASNSKVPTLASSTTFQSIGNTSKCSIQGLITESGPIKLLSFQGHPEFTTPQSLKMLVQKYENKEIDTAMFERLTYNTKNLINQGPIFAKMINTFFDHHI